MSDTIRLIADKLKALGVDVYLDANTSVGFNIPETPSRNRVQLLKQLLQALEAHSSLVK